MKTVAGKQWEVGREMNRRIRNEFHRQDIALMARWPQVLASEDPQPEMRDAVASGHLTQEAPKS